MLRESNTLPSRRNGTAHYYLLPEVGQYLRMCSTHQAVKTACSDKWSLSKILGMIEARRSTSIFAWRSSNRLFPYSLSKIIACTTGSANFRLELS